MNAENFHSIAERRAVRVVLCVDWTVADSAASAAPPDAGWRAEGDPGGSETLEQHAPVGRITGLSVVGSPPL